MNEIEARGKIKYRIANEIRKAGENKEAYEDLEIALQVMKEIREYRELGTIEELQKAKEQYDDIHSVAEKTALIGLSDYGTAKGAVITEMKRNLDYSLKEYQSIGTVEEFKDLKEKENRFDRNIKMFNEIGLEIRSNAIDEFAERLKERLKGMQMVELQGEDVCPCKETGEDCPYMNQDIGCQYCAREQTIKDVDEIAEQMKGGAE